MRSNVCHKVAVCRVVAAFLAASVFIATRFSKAEDAVQIKTAAEASTDAAPAKPAPPRPKLPVPKGAILLSRDQPVWIDPKENSVITEGQIALREGMLEMFACTRNTKEHESIVSVNTKAFLVHAALLRLGAEVGHPVQFQPEFKPPAGTEIEVLVRWIDDKGKTQQARAQDWIKDLKTKKAMEYPFVFAGSLFWVDPDTNKKYYQAERGDFVCVANFGTAMLDIPVKSSKSNEELEFEAFTEKIPPLGAPVQVVFKPKLKKQGAGGKDQGAEKKRGGEAKPAGKAK